VCDRLVATGVPAYSDDEILLNIVVQREAGAGGIEVDSASGVVVLRVAWVRTRRYVADPAGERVVRVQGKVRRASLLDGGRREGCNNGREAKGEGCSLFTT